MPVGRRASFKERILGPYEHKPSGKWKLVIAKPGAEPKPGRKSADETIYCESEAAAEELAEILRAQQDTQDQTTFSARDRYLAHLTSKGNRPNSLKGTEASIKRFFPDDRQLWSITALQCEKRYAELTERYSVDTHRNTLAETKTFMRWCVKQRWIPKSPVEHIEGLGKRKKGKPQLRIDEARAWKRVAIELAERGDDGAIAALTLLLLGMRCSEVVERVCRDVDDEGRILWIPCSKTEAGKRRLEIPEELQPFLLACTQGRRGDQPLFPPEKKSKTGFRWRDWPRHQVERICELAGVPEVCAHAMRGLHATLATDAGVTGRIVAASLGQDDVRTTHTAYATSESVGQARQNRALAVLDGGKKAAK